MTEEVKIPLIKTPTESYVLQDYPQAIDFAVKQNHVFWLADEVKVEKDKQDLLVNLTPTERHGVNTVTKLFTKYELFVGNEYWTEVISKRYPRPEIQRMANCFAYFELNVHAPFYAKLDQELGIATDEFYSSYTNDPVLADRMKFIDGILESDNELLALAGFSMIEGAILYSSFAFLKHFQSNGKNKMLNLVRGINFSVRDENLHSMAGAWLFKQVMSELGLTQDQKDELHTVIMSIALKISEHEGRIIDMIFEEGEITGINADQMKEFVKSRLNICLNQLGYDSLFKVGENPIAEWFYKGINDYQFNDFFSGIGNQYNRNWDKAGFKWKGKQL